MSPCGTATQLQLTRAKQDQLLQGIRVMADLQSAWLLLLFCALPPEASLVFAESRVADLPRSPPGLRPRDRPALFPAWRPQLALWSGSRSGRLLGFVGGHSAYAAAPTPAFGGRDPCQAGARQCGGGPVWLGDLPLPAAQRGLTVLGAPLGGQGKLKRLARVQEPIWC